MLHAAQDSAVARSARTRSSVAVPRTTQLAARRPRGNVSFAPVARDV
jgi:hypothetical protein